MKQITYQDILSIIANYHVRNKRLFGAKERHIQFLEDKYQDCNKDEVLSDAEIIALYRYVDVSLAKMKMKDKNSNGKETASFSVFKALHQLLSLTKPVIAKANQYLANELTASFRGFQYNKAYFMCELSAMLSGCSINPNAYIERGKKFDNTSNLCCLMISLRCLSPMIKLTAENDDMGSEGIAYRFVDRLFEMGIAYHFTMNSLQVLVSKLFADELSLIPKDDKIHQQIFLHESLTKLSDNDAQGMIDFVSAVANTEKEKLEQLLADMNAQEAVGREPLFRSLASLIKYIEAFRVPSAAPGY